MTKYIPLSLLSILVICGCDLILNENPPHYIKNVAAYKEGTDGILIYFILADESGAMTTSDGSVTITVSETISKWSSTNDDYIEKDHVLYSTTIGAKKTDFRKTKIGMGAFERDAIIFPVGRIEYSLFRSNPSETTGKVKIEFQRPDGKILKGEDSIFF